MNATTIITNGTPPPNAEITPTHVNIKIAIYMTFVSGGKTKCKW